MHNKRLKNISYLRQTLCYALSMFCLSLLRISSLCLTRTKLSIWSITRSFRLWRQQVGLRHTESNLKSLISYIYRFMCNVYEHRDHQGEPKYIYIPLSRPFKNVELLFITSRIFFITISRVLIDYFHNWITVTLVFAVVTAVN